MIDLWNTTNKENYSICYGYKHNKDVNALTHKEEADVIFRAREVRSRQNIELKIAENYMANKNIVILETGDKIYKLEKDDTIVYRGNVLIIDLISTKIYNSQLGLGSVNPSATSTITCRGDM